MVKLVLLRHGQSIWNKENKFSGWVDVDLSKKGIQEAKYSAKALKDAGIKFDRAYTSYLKRAIRTLWIVLDEMDMMWLPVSNSWRLNERHYGALQGLNKSETAEEHGEKQVLIWRRSYNIPPPPLKATDISWEGNDSRYSGVLKTDIPLTESLKDTVKRFMPYWDEKILPDIKKGKSLLIAAHGNTLRAIVKHLEKIPDDEISKLDIPTGIPLVYELDEKDELKILSKKYLADEETLNAAITKVKQQGKTQ